MTYQWIKRVSVFIASCLVSAAFAHDTDTTITLDFHHAAVSDVLYVLAKRMHKNVVVSPVVNEVMSLHLKQAEAKNAFDLVLVSQGLAQLQKGNVWYVAPQAEILKQAHDEVKLQEVAAETQPLVTRLWQIHYAKADDVVHLLQDQNYSLLSKRGQARVDQRTNVICVHDVVTRFSDIEALIKRIDVPVQQVLIEARLASVEVNKERTLGIDFVSRAMPYPEHEHRYSLAVVKLPDTSYLDVRLAALEQQGKGELISSPSLLTANQQTASIESGEEIPYQETTDSGATSVSFKKAVLSLSVTPQILPDEKVLLKLRVTQDRPSARLVLGVPAITTRQISTHILLKNGQTIVLGGIYETNQEHDVQEIPFLGKIPLVGGLFQQHNATATKRELLIFVTPKIVPQYTENTLHEKNKKPQYLSSGSHGGGEK